MDRRQRINFLVSRIATFLFSAIILSISLQSHAAKVKKIQTIEGITEYQLSNGLQVLLFQDNSQDKTTVNITYKVGSKHENYGETGMAHLLEHLVFKGTPKNPDITKQLKDRGADFNGTTYLERTNYYETFKATDDNLVWALSMEADRMVNSFISEKDLESEMTVVRNEFESGENSPWGILRQRVGAIALDWHNYSNSTIGARSDIENVKIENLQAFYKKYYQPDNATLIVGGKFDENLALKTIKKTFGKIKKPKRKLPEFYTLDPVQDGNREVTLRRVGSEQIIAAAYRIAPGAHEDVAALTVLGKILSSSPSGRLHKNLIDKNLAAYITAFSIQQKEPGLFFAAALSDTNTNIEESKRALLATTETISKNPITEEELERAKRSLQKEIELAFNNSQLISIELSEWISIGDWRLMFIERDRIESVTLNDVQRVAEYYFVESNRTFGQFIPTENPIRAEIPASPDVAALVDGYKGRKTIAAGEAFDATLENVAQREIRSSKNGIKISAVPIKTRGESVYIEARFGFGSGETLKGKMLASEVMAAMFTKGTSKYTETQIKDQFDIYKAKGGFSSSPQAVYFGFETTKEHLPDLITFVHELLTTASFPEKEFDLIKSRQLTNLNSALTQPQSLAFSAFRKALNNEPEDSIHYYRSLDEEIAAIQNLSLAEVKSLYTDLFGANDVQFGIAGDFDADSISKVIFDKFSRWKSKAKYAYHPLAFQNVEKQTKTIETPDKKNAIFVAGKNINLTHNDAEAAAMYVATRIIGGGGLSSRLADRIRKTDGLSYTVAAYSRLPKTDKNGRWFTYAISNPQNIGKVEQAFNEEMTKVIQDGVTQEELTSAIEGMLDEAKVARSNNQNLAKSLQGMIYQDRTIQDEIEFQKHLRSLSLDEVNAVIRKYLSTEDLTVIKAGDFANTPKE